MENTRPPWTGRLVRLRALERQDLSTTRAWVNNPQIAKWEGHLFPISSAQEERWFEETLRNENRKALIIERLDDKKALGCVTFDVDWKNLKGRLAITIGEIGEWNKGYGGDAIRTAVRAGFEEIALNRIDCLVLSENTRSVKMFQGCGFRAEGTLRGNLVWAGKPRDQVILSILRDDWNA